MKNLVGLLLIISISADARGFWSACYRFFVPEPIATSRYISIEKGQVYFNRVRVTSDFYPLETQLQGLEISNEKRFDGLAVTSLGEGFSSLAEHFVSRGARLTAVDPVYAIRNLDYSSARDAEQIRNFLNLDILRIERDAWDTRIPADSQDLVVSHALVGGGVNSHFQITTAAKVIDESIRIAKIGGEIRHSAFTSSEASDISTYLNYTYRGLKVDWIPVNRVWTTQNQEFHRSGVLLVIKKLPGTQRVRHELPHSGPRIMM